MRNFPTIATGLSVGLLALAAVAGCESGPGQAKEPPVLKVASPARSVVQGRAGQIVVTGTALPNAQGDAVAKVMVNNVAATVGADGAFSATISVGEGATLIDTVATDVNGATASDTRSIQAGALQPVGTKIDRAVAAAISADAFAKISAAAGPILKGLDLPAMLAPLQPMVSVGDEWANFALSVDDLKFSDIHISLTPMQGALSFSAEIDGLDVPGHMDFGGILVIDGSDTIEVTATKVVVSGTLDIAPAGTSGFKTTLKNPSVQLTAIDFDGSGLPGAIFDLVDLGSIGRAIASRGAELAMGPLVNMALGALGGPQQLDVAGHKLDLQVAPSAIQFTPTGALLEIDMASKFEGSDTSPGFIFTANGAPAMDATYGVQFGLADDLVNEMLAEVHALGMLNLSMPQDVGVFDTAQIQLTVPPMISADGSDPQNPGQSPGQSPGKMKLVLGDMFATFTSHGTPVAKAAINARVELAIAPATGGGTIALQLGPPEIHVDMLDDVANTTGLSSTDLAKSTKAFLSAQIDSISKLLVAIPVPAIAGLQFHDLAIGADAGYVMVSGLLQ
jgi:hypothetical protein